MRNSLLFIVIAAFVPAFAATAPTDSSLLENPYHYTYKYHGMIEHWYMRIGDDSTWAQPTNDLQDWQYVTGQHKHIDYSGIRWYRAYVRLTGEQDTFDELAILSQEVVSAYEIYWDGELIGANGVIADQKQNEVAGSLKGFYRIKRQATAPGLHILTIRLSNHHTKIKWPLNQLTLGYHYNLQYDYAHKGSYFLVVGGAVLICGLFCLVLFFTGNRHRSYLLFAVYCLINLFFDVYPTIYLYNDIRIDSLYWMNWLFDYGRSISWFFLLIFIIYTFNVPKKRFSLALALAAVLLSVWLRSLGYQYYIYYTEMVAVLAAVFLIIAIFRKATGSAWALAGLVGWRASQFAYMVPQFEKNQVAFYMAGELFFLFSIIVSISRSIYEQEKLLQEISLRSSRLEVDLLKKHIQPHFILNTLQSIVNWIKKKPENAVQLIESLAQEFQMIHRISDQKLIPLHQEIDLCNTHLRIMGFRLGAHYELRTEGVCDDQQVPPMIFHTLIENALTHAFKTQESGVLKLNCFVDGKITVFQLVNNGSRLQEIADKNSSEVEEGMGIRYIKARLQESYGDRWKMNYQLSDSEWLVSIEIHA